MHSVTVSASEYRLSRTRRTPWSWMLVLFVMAPLLVTSSTKATATAASIRRRAAAAAVETELPSPLYPLTPVRAKLPPVVAPVRRPSSAPHWFLHIVPFTTATTASPVHSTRRRARTLPRDTATFTCLLTASAGMVNVRALHDYGALVNICSGNLLKLGSMVASRLTGTTTPTRDSPVVPLAVLSGYASGTALARWCHGTRARQATTGTTTDTTVTRQVLVAVIPYLLVCFGLADVLGISTVRHTAWGRAGHVACQSMAYGMIHLAASDAAGGMVLFAITGYLSSVCKASVDAVQHDHRPTRIPWQHHACLVLSFLGGSILGSLLWDRRGPRSGGIARWIPVQTLTGLWYAAVFRWYAGRLKCSDTKEQ